MKNWDFKSYAVFVWVLLVLQACEANKYILINGKKNFLLDYRSPCKVELKSHFIREAFLSLKLSPKDGNMEINNLNEWTRELAEANGLERRAIRIEKKKNCSNDNLLVIEKGKTLYFSMVKSSNTWNNGKIIFTFPKSKNVLCNGKPLFKEKKELSLEIGGMRFIF